MNKIEGSVLGKDGPWRVLKYLFAIARVASFPGPETARLANVLNTRPLHLDLIAFVDVATRVRQLADIV